MATSTKIEMTRSSLDAMASKAGKFSTSIDGLASRVDRVNKALDMDVKAKANIGSNLTKIKANCTKEKEFYSGIQKGITRTKEDLFGEDTSLRSKILGTFGVIAGIVAGVVAGVVGAVSSIVSGTNSTSQTEATPGEGNAAGNNQPVKSDTDYMADINARYKDILAKSGKSSYRHYCPALVNDQLKAKGILNSSVGGNGCNIVRNLLANPQKANRPLVTYNSFDEVIKASQNGPVTDVVLSFDKGGFFTYTDSKGNGAGHVMMIDRIENGKVYFIDNTGASSTAASGNNGDYTAQCWSVDKFQKYYFGHGNKSAGIVSFA